MPNYFEISPTHDVLALREGKGSASFAVRYVGDSPLEARALAVPMDGVNEGWLSIEPPDQRKMEPGKTQTFNVNVTIPPGTTPGRYGFRLDVVSVRNPDEEYDRGPQVAFQVNPSAKPEPEKGFPWWLVIAAAVFLIIIIGGVVWWANSDGDKSRSATQEARAQQEFEEATEEADEEMMEDEAVVRPASPGVVARRDMVETLRRAQPDRSGTFQVQQTFSMDFDSAQQIPSRSGQADLWFRARTATDRVLSTRGNVALAVIGRQDAPALREVKSALQDNLVTEVDVANMRPGFWIAVRTSEGNFAAATAKRSVARDARSIELNYRLWEG